MPRKKAKISRTIKKDARVFEKDATTHFVYTLFIVFFTLCLAIAFFVVFRKQLTPSVTTPQPVISQLKQEDYRELVPPEQQLINGKDASGVIFHGSRDKKQVALTFDAEMTDYMKQALLSHKTRSSYDKRVIDVLNATHTKATLFLTGMWIELYPKETEQFSQNPLFELGSHSYTDSSYNGSCWGLKVLPQNQLIEEIGSTEKLLREYAHIDNKIFRFPGGCYSPATVRLVQSAGDIVVHWDVVGQDGFNPNANYIVRNVIDNVQNGSIIVLHMNGEPTAPETADALPIIIEKLKAKGYQFVKVSELLGISPEEHAE